MLLPSRRQQRIERLLKRRSVDVCRCCPHYRVEYDGGLRWCCLEASLSLPPFMFERDDLPENCPFPVENLLAADAENAKLRQNQSGDSV